MTLSTNWRELYRAALLELQPEELRRRIAEAENAIDKRMEELRREDSNSSAELLALDDALRGLLTLANTECKTPMPMRASFLPRKVAP